MTAVLGPTNTGKTHLALERMLGHESGMIGFPLRLLARENYERMVRVKGRSAVALVTGEERIVPPNARWFVATVEAMPLDRPVSFLAVDEIQLIADAERGHVFTDRLLHARGREETMFMGADTARPMIRRLVPEAEIVSRPRFSSLRYTGPRKLTRLPPRSAVVAFSIADVFEMAELLRRQRGGTAVVMGALSPRARNAQVAMYQGGEVDYMVATDAIGMGLNMDLSHVAFARLTKFDGNFPRRLTAAEMGQIAGRAGRHMNDGTFGTTGDLEGLDPETVFAIEEHQFDPLKQVSWRNSELDFRAVPLLLKSLALRPPLPIMSRVAAADDHQALEALGRLPEILARIRGKADVRLLWEVCQIPDFRKVMSEQHARLLARVFGYLTAAEQRLPTDWVAKQMADLDRVDGDIDALVQRIAHIRTWTYITHRPGWLADPDHWQARAIGIEDRLSAALHDGITQRFVDRRSAGLVRRLASAVDLAATVSGEGEVAVEGHYVGAMQGFAFVLDSDAGDAARTLLTAANRILRQEVERRAADCVAAPDTAFTLSGEGRVIWHAAPVARLSAGPTPQAPRLELLPAEFLDGALRDAVRDRLARFVRAHIATGLRPLGEPQAGLAAGARGLLFRLAEGLGTIDAASVRPLVAQLTMPDRQALSRSGVRFGTETVFVERLLKPAAVSLRSLLWSVHHAVARPLGVPPAGLLSVTPEAADRDPARWDAVGFRLVGPRAIRVDRLEAFVAALRQLSHGAPFRLERALAGLIGVPASVLPAILTALGYRPIEADGETRWRPAARKPRLGTMKPRSAGASPFQLLETLELR